MNDDYLLKNAELKSVHSDYNFAEQMQHDSINQLWRNKVGLWTLLSAACNDAAQECYEHIQNYTNKLIDIETCDIHSLKSIAKSVDLEFLTKNIKENYPNDILKLINLLSVPRHILLNSNVLLHSDSNIKIFGDITKRGSTINVDTVPLELLVDIKKNIKSILKILNNCSLFGQYTLLKLLKTNLPDLVIKDVDKYSLDIDLNYKNINDRDIYQITLNDIINYISSIRNEELKKYQKQSLMVDDNINYFYLLINIIKQNFYNKEKNIFIDGFYFNRETNKIEDHSNLIMRIVSSIYYDNDSYINDFICYHFYNLFKSKLFNNNLKMLYSYDNVRKIFIMNKDVYVSEYTEDEFKEKLKSYISDEIIDEFIEKNNISVYVKPILSFVEYLSFINLYNGLNNKNNDAKELDYDIISLNFHEKDDKRINKNLFYEIIEGKDNINSAILNISKELSDIVIHISYLREDIKNNIQKYGIVGTKKIVLDNLSEFFIKNYSDNKDWGYQSNFIINHYENYISSLFTSSTNLTNREKNNFSINLIEYYDTTDYLNIESKLGNVKIGEEIIGYEEQPNFYLDENNLIASSIVKNPIYEDVYAPCSNFVDYFNEKFWNSNNITYTSNISETINNNIQYYEQYFDDCKEKISIYDKDTFIKSSVIPFIEKVWDEFALSGYSELSKDSEIGELFTKYIGNIDGDNRFLNHENSIFPTIAPFQNIDGLIETSKFESDILFLSKYYYKNVMESIINYTKLILKMYDKNSVPHNGWMQSYVSFHGYTTKYEYSQKLTSQIKNSEKNIDVDGPWSYSTLQKIYYDHFNENEISIDNLIKYIDIIDENEFSIKDLYSKYLIDTKNDKDNLFFGEKSITGYVIDKLEYDMFNNSYSLLKSNNELTGKLIFRSYEMIIGLPFYEFIEYDGMVDNLVNLSNNCIDFGIKDDFMWLFGYNKSINSYQIISFKFNYDFNHIVIDDNTLKYHSYNTNGVIDNLNDFICTAFNENENEINFIFINQLNELKKISDNRYVDFKNLNINFYIDCLDLDKNENYIFILECKNVVLPLMLDDEKHKNENKLAFINDHRIWKNQMVDLTNYICYEALNTNKANYFNYYKNFEKYAINFQVLNISWDIDEYYFKDNEFFYSKNIKIKNNGYDSLILNNTLDINEKIKKIYNFMNEYPKCYIENGHLNINLIPYSTSNLYDEKIINKIISSFIEQNKNEETLTGYFNFNDYSILDRLLINESENKEIIKLYEDFRECNNFLSSVNFDFNDDVFIKSSFDVDSQSSELFKKIQNAKNCLFEPLKLTICYENESGISFINDFALDLDIACYINDKSERNKKVGYGNKFKETSYIKWSGDKNIEGNENLTIDILKYVKNNFHENEYDFDDEIEIVLNTCWFNSSEIKDGNVFVIANWQNIFEKIPLRIIGENGGRFDKSCETRSIIFKLNKKYLTLSYDIPKQYFSFKYTLKETLNGIEDGIPDFQIGLINLSSNELSEIKNNNKYQYFEDNNILIRIDEDKESRLKYVTVLLCNEYFDRSTESDLFNRTKKLLNEYLNIILKDDVKNQVLKLFEWKDLRLNEIYFGLYYDNVDKNTGINYFYYGYVNPTFYKAATLKSAVTSNYVLNLLNSKYPIMISMKEEIRNNMNDILNREER